MIKYRKIRRMVVCMKKEFSKNTTEVFTKTMFHYIPKILGYTDNFEITYNDIVEGCNGLLNYLKATNIID